MVKKMTKKQFIERWQGHECLTEESPFGLTEEGYQDFRGFCLQADSPHVPPQNNSYVSMNFTKSDFKWADFNRFRFEDCHFEKCFFSKVKVASFVEKKCSFTDCLFEGIRFTKAMLGFDGRQYLNSSFLSCSFGSASFIEPIFNNILFKNWLLFRSIHFFSVNFPIALYSYRKLK